MADVKGKGKAREEPLGDAPQNPQLIRITNHGKIQNWVSFALDFLDKHELIPIVLHTLPDTSKSTPIDNAEGAKRVSHPPSLSHTASTVPRLITVVEIIKREYLKKLELAQSSTLLGLHQYNEIGTLEEELNIGAGAADSQLPDDPDAQRSQAIIAALEGKSHLKTKQTPFMRITLSKIEVPGLTTATYQPPQTRKISKSAKARAKRREKKAAEGILEPAEDMVEEP
ncbi:hypothetical protein R3P38DRAFT_2881269 [Favolaschia claudopus]|uniref:Uncharacterized protein n=1 Tax=Favolaschia claudopus TaxID=2862362 RepID=A0AAW0D259_9AGAR